MKKGKLFLCLFMVALLGGMWLSLWVGIGSDD